MYQPESIDQALSLLNKKLKREGRHRKNIKEFKEDLYAEFSRI